MAKTSPIQTTFNGGEWSPLLEGRVDLKPYPTSLRRMRNMAGIAEGMATRRPGTEFRARAYSNTDPPRLLAFEADDSEGTLVEVCAGRYRFHTETSGLTTRTPTAITVLTIDGSNIITVTSVAHGASVGEQVVFDGFSTARSIQGAVGTITAVTTDTMTIAAITNVTSVPTLVSGETVARVYHITNPYTADQLRSIQMAQSIDVGYLFADGPSPRVLAHFAATNWTDAALDFVDGPYLSQNTTSTTLTITTRGHAVDAYGGSTSTSSAGTPASNVMSAVDLPGGYWVAAFGVSQTLTHDFGSTKTIDAYCVERAYLSEGGSGYTYEDQTSTWYLQGSPDNATWTTIDRRIRYAGWLLDRSELVTLLAPASYRYFRFTVNGAGTALPALGRVLFRSPGVTATVVASSTTGINNGDGFATTDVGRHIRIKDSDGYWKWGVIASRVSSTSVTITLRDAPFRATSYATTEWRLGLYSETTGYPRTACFFQDRLWMDGGPAARDTLCASMTGGYSATTITMSPTATDGTVLDTSGMTATLNSRKLSAIRWIVGDDQGLVVGTGSAVWIVRSADQKSAITAANRDARQVVFRGVADVDPVQIDNQIVCANSARTRAYELVYNDNVLRYAPSDLTIFAAHLTSPGILTFDYSAEPYSMLWSVTDDGGLLGCTYIKAMDVLGWHKHTIGAVDDIAVMRNAANTADALWVCSARIVGSTQRFIERMTPWQQYTDVETDAWYVDCGLRYDGDETDTITGLWHLEGLTVSVCADGAAHAQCVVESGAITLSQAASIVTVGIGYDSSIETQRPEGGVPDGSAQGRAKRINKVTVRLWQAQSGTVGRPDGDYEDIELFQPGDPLDTAVSLFSGDVTVNFPAGYDTDGTVLIQQSAAVALPLNILALIPHVSSAEI